MGGASGVCKGLITLSEGAVWCAGLDGWAVWGVGGEGWGPIMPVVRVRLKAEGPLEQHTHRPFLSSNSRDGGVCLTCL